MATISPSTIKYMCVINHGVQYSSDEDSAYIWHVLPDLVLSFNVPPFESSGSGWCTPHLCQEKGRFVDVRL